MPRSSRRVWRPSSRLVTPFVASALLMIAGLGRTPVMAQEPVVSACDDPAGHSWIADTSDRVMAENELIAFAMAATGDPVSCEGSILVWQG